MAGAPPPESKQAISWAVLFATLIPATICFAMRMQSRRLTKLPLWWDDYMAIIGYSCSIIWLIIVPIWIHYGLGLHIEDVKGHTVNELLFANKLILWIAEFVYAFSLYFAKTSILCFYWRVFGVSNIKLAIKILLGCALIWIIIRTFLGIFHCIPVQAYWDSEAGGFCAVEDTKFFFGSILVHVILDICIIALPIVPIMHLSLPFRQKMGITVVFMFGIFICVAGVMIIFESTKFDATSSDLTWNIEPIVTWATVEVNMVVVSASLPTLRPALLWIVGRRPNSTANSDPSTSYGKAHSNHHTTNSRSQITKRGIMLSSVGRRQSVAGNKKVDFEDDTGSTYQLADSVHGNSSGEFENHALDRHADFRTVINANGRMQNETDGRTSPVAGRNGRRGSLSQTAVLEGIVVQSETSIKVEERRMS